MPSTKSAATKSEAPAPVSLPVEGQKVTIAGVQGFVIEVHGKDQIVVGFGHLAEDGKTFQVMRREHMDHESFIRATNPPPPIASK